MLTHFEICLTRNCLLKYVLLEYFYVVLGLNIPIEDKQQPAVSMGDFGTLGGNRLTRYISIVYILVLSMRILLTTMYLPGNSAATYRPKCPISMLFFI